MNQVGNSKFPPSGHLIFFSTNIRNENKTREIQKWPRARDRIVHVIPQVSKMKAYIFNYKIHVHEIMLCMIFYKTTRFN
jgi:hypothetical protein